MNTYEIAKEVLAVSLHIAESHNFDLQETKKRMQQLTESVLKTNLLRRQGKHSNQTVDLEFQQIDNLKDLLPHLANCSNLRELILHGNRLHTLPDDLSILTTVETLDISNNLFDDIIPIVKALKTMPKLFHLHIGIRDWKEEQYIIQELTNLITLNNKRIRFFDQLDSERQSERQSARSDRQQEVQFNQEDVQNMESLYEQICNLTQENTEKQTNQLSEHVRLVMTDFSNKVSQTHSKHFLDTHILKAKFDLYEICFRELIDYFRTNNNKLEKVLQSLKEENSAIFNDLTNIIYNLKDYKKIQSDNQQIEQALFNSELVTRLNQEIQSQKNQNLQLKQELLLQTQHKDQLIISLQSKVSDLENDIQMSHKEKENIFNQCSQLEFQLAQVRSASRQNSQKQISQNQSFQDLQSFSYMQTQQVVLLVKGTQTLTPNFEEKQCQTVDFEETINQTQSIAYQSIQQELEELQCQNEQLQVENKKYLEMIIKKTKGERITNLSESSFKQPESLSFIEKKRVKSINESRLLVSPQSFRPLSLKQLKECIDDIFESKYKHDVKQYENKMAQETIEQHMYTFLNCKYGLKNLALEWAACIINAVHKYLSEDNDIAVFALMLKNQIDEDFRKTQNESKKVMEQLIKLNLQGKYKNKHISEIKEMVKQKVNGYLTHQEVLEILSQIYKQEEIDMLMAQLKQHQVIVQNPNVSPQKNTGTGIKKDQLRRSSAQKTPIQYEYAALIKITLDYQMKQHQLYISCIVHAFSQVDHDSNGIINEVQFRKLIEILNIQLSQEEYVELYNTLDPFMNNQLTFSQLVRVFSNSAFFDNNKNLMQQIQLI